jgi:hypothetical protein
MAVKISRQYVQSSSIEGVCPDGRDSDCASKSSFLYEQSPKGSTVVSV